MRKNDLQCSTSCLHTVGGLNKPLVTATFWASISVS